MTPAQAAKNNMLTANYNAQSANYTVAPIDSDAVVNVTVGSSADVTVTLPTAVGITGFRTRIRKADAGTKNLIIATTSSQTLTGASTSAVTTLTIIGQGGFVWVQSDGANWVVLDNYDFGNFTPVLNSSGGGSGTYSIQVGRFSRRGSIVQIQIYVALSNLNTLGVGIITCDGLPFTASGLTNSYRSAPVAYCDNVTLTGGKLMFGGYIGPGNTGINIVELVSAGGATSLPKANLANTSSFMFDCFYEV